MKDKSDIPVHSATIGDVPILVDHHRKMFEEIWSARGLEIDDHKFEEMDKAHEKKLSEELLKNSPKEKIIITSIVDEETKEYEIVLGEHPENESLPWLGIGFVNQESSGIVGNIVGVFSSFKKPNVYYKPKFEASSFVYNLLWWLALISLSVALINMLPVGIFDGGRFFYLTIWGLTGKEKTAKNFFKFSTYFFLFLLLLLMIFWAKSFW